MAEYPILKVLRTYFEKYQDSTFSVQHSDVADMVYALKDLKKDDLEFKSVIQLLSSNKNITRLLTLVFEKNVAETTLLALDPSDKLDIDVFNFILATSEDPPEHAIRNATNADKHQEKLVRIMKGEIGYIPSKGQQFAAIGKINSSNIEHLLSYEETTIALNLREMNKAVRARIKDLITEEKDAQTLKKMSFALFGKICEKEIQKKHL